MNLWLGNKTNRVSEPLVPSSWSSTNWKFGPCYPSLLIRRWDFAHGIFWQSEAQFFMTRQHGSQRRSSLWRSVDDRARLAECAARAHQKDSGASELVLASWLGVGWEGPGVSQIWVAERWSSIFAFGIIPWVCWSHPLNDAHKEAGGYEPDHLCLSLWLDSGVRIQAKYIIYIFFSLMGLYYLRLAHE